MCGFCTEVLIFEALGNNAPKLATRNSLGEAKNDWLNAAMFLQETDSLNALLEQFSQKNLVSSARSVVCRAIEILAGQGFESAAYQALVQQPQFRFAITAACDKAAENQAGTEIKLENAAYQALVQHPHYLSAIAAASDKMAADQAVSDTNPHFQTEKLAWLLEQDTYFVAGCFAQHHARSTQHMAHGILCSYADWWLNDGSVLRQDIDQIMKKTGIFDPIQNIPDAERRLLKCRFPAIWYSLHCLNPSEENKDILWRIITANLSGTPDFDGIDLWLQRRAAVIYFDWYGIGPFLDNRRKVRDLLFQYLAAKRVFKEEERNRIIATITEIYDHYVTDLPSDWQWAGFA